MSVSIEVDVRSTDIDRMGHLNHAKYLEYMEWSRERWLSTVCGLTPEVMTSRDLGLAVVHVSIDYRREICLGQKLQVKTVPLRAGRTSFTVRNEILNADGDEMAAADKIVTVLFDLNKRCAVPLIPELRAQFAGTKGL